MQGFILALQGASELRRFGALHYVIDLVAVGFTREPGPLLTAIPLPVDPNPLEPPPPKCRHKAEEALAVFGRYS